jgi:hypothetical protein
MEEKQVNIGGAQPMQKNVAAQMQQEEFIVPMDVVELPSQGKLYPNGQTTVKVKYLTAEDENILMSPELIRTGKVLDALLDNCVIADGLTTKEMLIGDRNKVLIDLRINGYGHEYEVEMTDPETNLSFTAVVDLRKLKPKPLEITPDSMGEFTVTLPKFNVPIKFRFLNGDDEDFLTKKAQVAQKKNKKGFAVSNTLTERYLRQIMEVKGNRDKFYIQKFIGAMPISDSLFLREYISEIEPGIDLNYEFEAPSGATFEADVPLTVKLFWPSARI